MGHLGGHCNTTHCDDGVLKYLKNKFQIKSMLDIGCGPGGMRNACTQNDIEWTGIDGDPHVKNRVTHFIDFQTGTMESLETFDLAWSIEFLEHVFEEYQDNYMKCFEKAKYVFCTAAPPGKPGHHHVNCRDKSYWTDVFNKYGFEYDDKITIECKKHSTMKREFVQECGMFFKRV
jgi:cyclopropane fatty-acyl-phospholipid synthase-like methyltransferase